MCETPWVDEMVARIVFLRSKGPAGIEPRIDKEARALAGAGYDVHVVLWDRNVEFPAEEARSGYLIHRVRIRAPEGRPGLVLKMPRWWLAAWTRVRDLRPDAVHAIDLDTFPVAFVAKRSSGVKLVYDAFDFYAPMIALNLRPAFREFLSRAERCAAQSADLVILPALERSAFFGEGGPRWIVEIMNVPEDRTVSPTPQASFTVFYGGQIARDRGLGELVQACEAAGARLVVAGHGPDEATLVPLIRSSPAAQYLGTLPYEEVLRWTASCHVVAALYDPAIPNNRWTSPNKLFEAMMLKRPLLTNEGTSLGEFVREKGLGAVARYGDLESVAQALEDLMASREARRRMGARGRRLYEDRFRWDTMRDRLVVAYRELLGA